MNQENSVMSGELIGNLIGVVEKVEPKFCRNCQQPIEMLTDPWGKELYWVHLGAADWSWEGEEDGWHGTNGEKCQDADDNEAEPETDEERLKRLRGTPYFLNPEGKEEFAPGISRLDYDRQILRSE